MELDIHIHKKSRHVEIYWNPRQSKKMQEKAIQDNAKQRPDKTKGGTRFWNKKNI